MAMIFRVIYPSGEITTGTGYPNKVLVVREVPPGPASCYLDELEVDFSVPEPHPVKRILRGPRRPTVHVRVEGTEVERERWMDAREAEGFATSTSPTDESIVWCVACRDGIELP